MSDIGLNLDDGLLISPTANTLSIAEGGIRLLDGIGVVPSGALITESGTAPADCVAQGNPTNTELLIHSDTTDGSTTFTDSSDNGFTITAGGDVQHDTDQAKFGASSILFDGTGDYLQLADSSSWAFGSGDFTIDFWVRFNSLASTSALVTQWGSGQQSFAPNLQNSTTLRFNYSTTGSNVVIPIFTGSALSTGTWYHIAFARSGNDLKAFVDGTQYGSTYDITGVTLHDSTDPLRIGTLGTSTWPLNGWIDEFRIVKGEAKWTSNFTPPAKKYCDDS